MSSSAPATPAGTPPKSNKSSPQDQPHVPAIVREVCELSTGVAGETWKFKCVFLSQGVPAAVPGEDHHEVLARRRGRQPGVALSNHQSHGKWTEQTGIGTLFL